MELMPGYSCPKGYKQTEVGVIPEGWEAKNLGALVTYTNGKAHEQNITDTGQFVVVNSKFISSEGVTRKYSDRCCCPTSKGDVLMVMSDVPNGRAIAKCFYVDTDGIYTVNQRICALNPTGVDGKLLFYMLNRHPYYLAFDDGVQQTNLRKEDVLSCPLSIPKSDDEQRTIAGALGDVDALIGALDRLIAKKRDLKQAAMQQLLIGQIRLPGFSGEWEVKRLGELLEYEQPTKYLVKDSEYSDENDVPVLTAGKTFVLGFTNEENGIFNNLPAIIFDDFTTANKYVTFPFKAKSSAMKILKPRDATVNLRLIFEAMQLIKFPLGDHKRYWISEYRNLEIKIPKADEQTAIAAVLSDMDAEIAALEARRNKTRALKQGMMQELLTGRTRLV